MTKLVDRVARRAGLSTQPRSYTQLTPVIQHRPVIESTKKSGGGPGRIAATYPLGSVAVLRVAARNCSLLLVLEGFEDNLSHGRPCCVGPR